MRLNQIKLAGFKSFVDPTTVGFPANLTGVVGPNGCGKSNIIDAVRWVMGESSAKYLRGESMADVIFNGSINRKPAGLASIELHFDNSAGKLGGLYAQYSEIVIRRQVNLEGQSIYYLNGSACRRRDITDIFLGTGLGPRSYGIIEQGTISRLIEAKPEELRVYLEEAAGISKYKERRRETELRLQHTRDNLARLNDIRDELQKQLDHLSKQAQTAEKYQVLKTQEKTLRAELFALRAKALESHITVEKEIVQREEIQLEALNAEFQTLSSEKEIEQQKAVEKNEALQVVQKVFYEANTKLARLEEQIQHHRERKRQAENALLQIEQDLAQQIHLQSEEKTRFTTLEASHHSLAPQLDALKEKTENFQQHFKEIETQFHADQQAWDEFNQKAAKNLQEAQVEQTKIQHLEKHLQQLEGRIEKIKQEQETYAQLTLPLGIENLQKQIADIQLYIQQHQEELQQLREQLQHQRDESHAAQMALDQSRTTLQSLRGRYASLQELQESALGKKETATQHWLKENHFEGHARLAQQLKVQEGWEYAVETVLNRRLEAIDMETSIHISIKPNTLASVCTGPASILNLLNDVYLAETWKSALEMLPQLDAKASVITREGIWVGHGWLCAMKSHDQKDSVIIREKMLKELQAEITQQTQRVEDTQAHLQKTQELIKEFEAKRDEKQKALSQLSTNLANSNAELKVQEATLAQHDERKRRLLKEHEELQHQKVEEEKILATARQAWEHLLKLVEEDALKREQLQKNREEARVKLQEAREQFTLAQQQHHALATQLQVLQTQMNASHTSQVRLATQVQSSQQRQQELITQRETLLPQEESLSKELNALLLNQQSLEKEVQEKRAELSVAENHLRELERNMQACEEKRARLRSFLEEKRLLLQTASTKINSIAEQLQEMEESLETLLAALSPEADEKTWEEALNKTVERINRLGAINLAAIAEHEQQSERKQYLDQQHDDLITALNTLEEAIRKIDKETRAKFKEIYDKVNGLFQELFPRIFGGGQAYLELTGEDLLETGVNVIARPPGKRNSTIHLLSGGEKALTAIALVFSIFQLNPAPFCMLDEVDAPLDDNNIGRFCELVKEMSKSVQFIFISHNKLAIEMAEHLVGVTMNEPGVSRLVAVDVNAAMEMAEA